MDTIWMGSALLKAKEGNADVSEGTKLSAIIILYADSEDSFKVKSTQFLETAAFEVLEYAEVVCYEELSAEYDFDEDIEEAVCFLEETKKPQMAMIEILGEK